MTSVRAQRRTAPATFRRTAMAKVTPLATVLACPLVLGAVVTPAQAQLARTFVSSLGNDANDCNRPTPCRTFQVAHDKTLANGEITVIDPGGYGAVTITKTISIINDGVGEAGVLVSGGLNGITINAGASDAVSLRGLTVKGIGFGGGNGIVFNTGKSLAVENCAIRNLNTNIADAGIDFAPSTPGALSVSNTLVADNATGIRVRQVGSATAKAMFSRVEASGNAGKGFTIGSLGTGNIDVAISDSVAAGNGARGVRVLSTTAKANVMVIRSVIAHNNTGLSASGQTATLWFGQS